jgi:hypothetical protein
MEDRLFQIKRELITDLIKESFPNAVKLQKPMKWWLDMRFKNIEDLEEVLTKEK